MKQLLGLIIFLACFLSKAGIPYAVNGSAVTFNTVLVTNGGASDLNVYGSAQVQGILDVNGGNAIGIRIGGGTSIFNNDGSGSLVNANISWTTAGTLTIGLFGGGQFCVIGSDGSVQGTLFRGNGTQITNLVAGNLSAGGTFPQEDGHNLTGFTISQIPQPTLVSTNWISGQLYTNLSGRLQEVQVTAACTAASVAGGAVQRLQTAAQGSALATIAQYGFQTISGTLVTTNTGIVHGYIPANNVFTFTNLVGGAGDSAINLPGTGQLITH